MNNTIDAQAVLAQMRALTAQARGLELPRAVSDANPLAGATPAVNFGDVMKNALNFVTDQQVTATKLQDRFERGDKGVDVAEVMVAIQKASLSFQAATQVRNKLVSAYQDIMNMPL
jgi:flagellar hook-basal body complex protein FliE